MKTLVLTQPGRFELTARPRPAALPPGHARVRVRRVGICGTDWHAYHGRQPFFSYPRVLGHELAVELEELNDPASSLQPGDRCAVEPYLNCGACLPCRRGRTNCCTTLQCLGVHTDGGMTEQLILPARKLHKSAALTFDQLALVETLAIGSHAVARSRLTGSDTVLVLGAGPIGLSVLPFAQAAGAQVLLADISEPRLAFARTLADATQTLHTFLSDDTLPDQLKAHLNGDLPTVILDATGNPASMARTFDLLSPSGTIVFVGLFQGDLSFNDPNFHRREITLSATRNALPEDFTKIISLIETGRINTTPWITHRAKAEDFLTLLPAWLAPNAGLLKAVLEF